MHTRTNCTSFLLLLKNVEFNSSNTTQGIDCKALGATARSKGRLGRFMMVQL
jgi:hypothetical protein